MHDSPTTPARATRRPLQRVLRALGGSARVLAFVVKAGVVVGAVAIVVAWRVYGYTPVAVQTGSMAPTFPVHTLLFVHDVPVTDVRVGDVITFDPPGRVPRTTHRVVARELHGGSWYFRTKGDANRVADDWRVPGSAAAASSASYMRGVSYSDGTAVRSEFHAPHLGWLATLGAMPRLRMGLLLVPFLVVAFELLRWIWGAPAGRDGSEVGAGAAADAPGAAGGGPGPDPTASVVDEAA